MLKVSEKHTLNQQKCFSFTYKILFLVGAFSLEEKSPTVNSG